MTSPRKIDDKGRSSHKLTVDLNTAAVGLNDRLRQRQAQPDALGVLGKTAAVKPLIVILLPKAENQGKSDNPQHHLHQSHADYRGHEAAGPMFFLGVILSALFRTKFAIYDDTITRKFVEQIAVLNQVPLSWAGGRQKPEQTAVQVQIPLLWTLPHGPAHPTEAVKSVRQGGKKISSHLVGRFSVAATIPADWAVYFQPHCATTVIGLHLFSLQKEEEMKA